MNGKRNQHEAPRDSEWAVKSANSDRATKIFDRKSDAVQHAREIAKSHGGELVIHGKAGKIQSKDSHGNGPYPPKG